MCGQLLFDNEEALHHRIVDVCHTICNYSGTLEYMRRRMMRLVEAPVKSHGEHFKHLS
jgi:hypothetical protein